MARWSDVTAGAPELARRVESQLDAHRHKVLATIRRDGSPRVSGVEATFREGDLWLGMMGGSRKALDLRRDQRFALHSATVDPELVAGDAKVAGRAVEVTDPGTLEWFSGSVEEERGEQPPEPFHLFRTDVTEVVLTTIGDPADHLVIESWHEDAGLRRVERS
jgi:Pyridoxamine 5'-phosphate oxidase